MPSSRTKSVNTPSALVLPIEQMRRQLLDWYAREGRSLPWRNIDDPYAIWVSEVMLQQTQVKTVLPYYERWLTEFPTVRDLAGASRDRVLKLWEGLGYYSRARNFHQAAQLVVDRHDGTFPTDIEAVLDLPGIGRTTAGGILSSAFNLPAPILDGNVKRVLSRLVALPTPPAKALPRLWHVSAELLDPNNARDYNQALLDLGATLCRSRQPDCQRCPWRSPCAAYQSNSQHLYPMKSPKAERPHKRIAVAVVVKDGLLLIDQRPESGMLGGLWEFPGGKIEPGETPQACAVREVKEEVGIEVEVVSHLGDIEHAYSHFSVTLHTYICRHINGEPQTLEVDDVRWILPSDISAFAFPVANQKIFPLLHNYLKETA